MRANRQDAWTKEEDQLLAKTVIEYIKKGHTQLESFKHVADQLNRTPAACGFRWNATIRKRYTSAIEEAKQSRKLYQYDQMYEQNEDVQSNHAKSTLDQAIHWLEKLKNESENDSGQIDDKLSRQMIEENKRLQQELVVYQTLINNIKKLIEEID
ncbi:Myb-like DNA-binding domain-containing protein [Amphibacillus sp. Q70]|uniref:Myb-like DNA-binding domain-containing protein n=1 Tax=Amphibacillus sp. Q70 TaxID=3453416 RepID=UPI003F835A36